jgi:RNA polymerase sigma-70 factor (ECF subfamily)
LSPGFGFTGRHAREGDAALPPFSDDRKRRFELLALPHLDAAYNLARWLVGNASEAEDVVQEAYLRAYRYFDTYQGGDVRPWLLTIVRNCFSTLARHSRSGRTSYVAELPTENAGQPQEPLRSIPARDPEALLLHGADTERVNALMLELPPDYREVLLLREVEELSYRQIAEVVGVPVGTVMSRLARARATLLRRWFAEDAKESAHEV